MPKVKAGKALRNEAYTKYAAVPKPAAQHRDWAFRQYGQTDR